MTIKGIMLLVCVLIAAGACFGYLEQIHDPVSRVLVLIFVSLFFVYLIMVLMFDSDL